MGIICESDGGFSMEKRKILILFYSLTGGTAKIAREVAVGASETFGTDVQIKRVPELIHDAFFEQNPQIKSVKESLEKEFPAATVDDLTEADGVAFGTPVHFGSFASQIKNFIDQLSPVWLQGKLVNKPAALFCSSGSLHGGEETTLASLMIPLFNLGMIPVGIPYPIQGESPDFDAGSPYGAVFVTGHRGEKPFSEADKKIARILGKRLALMTHLLSCGCETCESCRTLKDKEK